VYSADLCEVDIDWDGVRRTIYADSFGADLVIGTELLRDYDLFIRFVNGGAVRLDKVKFGVGMERESNG
jgi:hypothetical protein